LDIDIMDYKQLGLKVGLEMHQPALFFYKKKMVSYPKEKYRS